MQSHRQMFKQNISLNIYKKAKLKLRHVELNIYMKVTCYQYFVIYLLIILITLIITNFTLSLYQAKYYQNFVGGTGA